MPSNYLKSKGWNIKEHGSQFIVDICPLCSCEGWHFYMNRQTGQWDCKKCGRSGGIFTLKSELEGIEKVNFNPAAPKQFKAPELNIMLTYHNSLKEDAQTLEYLTARGISQKSIDHFKLGLKKVQHARWLSIPHRLGNELVNIKYRSLPPSPKTFRREEGCRSILFNQSATEKHDTIIITEGELDAVTLWQHGYENIIGTTLGANGFDPQWFDALLKCKKIYLCYDSDKVGQEGALGVAKRLGYNRCLNIVLPTKDANDFFQKHTKEDFDDFIKHAKSFTLPGITDARAVIELLSTLESKPADNSGIKTRWASVNRLIGQWGPGDLIIVTALPKTGKTTFCLDITRDQVLAGIPSLFYCLEMRPERLLRKFIQAQYRIENPSLMHINLAKPLFQDMPLYLCNHFVQHKIHDLIDTFKQAIDRYGIKFLVFDNLHLLCRSLNQVNEEMAQALFAFKMLAETKEIPIVLIAQPRKRENIKEVMTAEDIRSSSAVHSDCDQMIILHRNRKATKAKDIGTGVELVNEVLEPATLVRIEAHRYGSGGETVLYYHGELSRFDEMALKQQMRVVK